MAKLGKNVMFVLTEKFWKDYKPALVPDSGLGGKLKNFEKKYAEATKLEDDKKALDILKANKWGEALRALSELTGAMPAAIKGLEGSRAKAVGKLLGEKEGIENLKDSLEKSYKLLSSHSHPSYQSCFGRQQKYLKLAVVDKGKQKADEFTDYVDKLDKKELRAWKSDVRELVNLTPKQFMTSDFTDSLRSLSTWDRKGTLESMTGPKSFASDMDRNINNRKQVIVSFEKQFNMLNKQINLDPKAKTVGPKLMMLIKAMKSEQQWWENVKKTGVSKIK